MLVRTYTLASPGADSDSRPLHGHLVYLLPFFSYFAGL